MSKSYFIISLFIALFAFSGQVFGQEKAKKNGKYQTVTLKVEGVCNMCKSRIETTVYDVKGVKSAEWDKETSMLEAVIRPSKTSRKKIAEALALAGHRSELMTADKKAYAELPGCCQYDDGVEKH